MVNFPSAKQVAQFLAVTAWVHTGYYYQKGEWDDNLKSKLCFSIGVLFAFARTATARFSNWSSQRSVFAVEFAFILGMIINQTANGFPSSDVGIATLVGRSLGLIGVGAHLFKYGAKTNVWNAGDNEYKQNLLWIAGVKAAFFALFFAEFQSTLLSVLDTASQCGRCTTAKVAFIAILTLQAPWKLEASDCRVFWQYVVCFAGIMSSFVTVHWLTPILANGPEWHYFALLALHAVGLFSVLNTLYPARLSTWNMRALYLTTTFAATTCLFFPKIADQWKKRDGVTFDNEVFGIGLTVPAFVFMAATRFSAAEVKHFQQYLVYGYVLLFCLQHGGFVSGLGSLWIQALPVVLSMSWDLYGKVWSKYVKVPSFGGMKSSPMKAEAAPMKGKKGRKRSKTPAMKK